MSEEVWRVLPEFPMYEITEQGDIRNRDTLKVLKEVENPSTGAFYYCLRKRKVSSTYCRNFWGLVYSAFPELDGVWAYVPDFPGYQVNPDGEVRSVRRKKILPKNEDDAYILRRDGVRHRWRIEQLGDLETFWKRAIGEEEAA
jgi:hypothetical protein